MCRPSYIPLVPSSLLDLLSACILHLTLGVLYSECPARIRRKEEEEEEEEEEVVSRMKIEAAPLNSCTEHAAHTTSTQTTV